MGRSGSRGVGEVENANRNLAAPHLDHQLP